MGQGYSPTKASKELGSLQAEPNRIGISPFLPIWEPAPMAAYDRNTTVTATMLAIIPIEGTRTAKGTLHHFG